MKLPSLRDQHLKNANTFRFPALRNDLEIQKSEEGYYVIRCPSDGMGITEIDF